MRTPVKFFISLLAAGILLACSSTQKVTLDPVSVSELKPGVKVYRATYTKDMDILHTRLELKPDWDSAFLHGKAYIDARPYFYPSNKIVLNAQGFKINAVGLVQNDTINPLKYSYNKKLLSIQLDRHYTRQDSFKLLIDYVAMPRKLVVGRDIDGPDERGLYFMNNDGSDKSMVRHFWTQGETESNSAWFPTIEGPQEKMTQEISITVPSTMVTLSNGSLDYSAENGDGTRTDTWRQEQPHAPYLAMIAGGEFKVVKEYWREKEVSYYMEPQYIQHAKMVFGKTPAMMDFFSKITGVDYPWDKYSQVVVRGFYSGAMENTTASVFTDRMNMTPGQYQDENHEDLIAHELFHHWFGNYVTGESWSNLPLNEAFANYGQYLWNEHAYGREVADAKLQDELTKYLNNSMAHERDVIRFDYANNGQMFDAVSYQKGGRILHMLRKTVGDEAFFKSLNLYLTTHAYKTAEIHDLRLAFEEVTGRDLNWFFNQWFLASGHPVLSINSQYNSAGKEVIVSISQDQPRDKTPLYRLPIAIDIYTNGKIDRKQVLIDKQSQTFRFALNAEPQLVNVDAEKQLVAIKKETKPLNWYMHQYTNAPLYMDRFEALEKLAASQDKAPRQLVKSALNDKHWKLRLMAISHIKDMDAAARSEVYEQIKKMATADTRSLVRAAAITCLKEHYPGSNNTDVFKKAKADEAPSVIKALN